MKTCFILHSTCVGVNDVKIYYIKFTKALFINLAIICVLIGLFLSLILYEPVAVFNTFVPSPIYKGDDSKPNIAFACNVVWGTEYVPEMLKIFKNNSIKITFFLGGQWVKDNPDVAKMISSYGHELGNHGYGHKKHSTLSLDDNKKEILSAQRIIEKYTGHRTRLFGPPYGDFNEDTLEAARDLGYQTVLWSIDTIDWKGDGPGNIINRVLKNPHNGAIVLMHPTEDTVKALPVLIQKLKELGYSITTVSRVIQ